MFGSQAGGTGYPYVQALSTTPFLTAFVLIPVLILLADYSSRRIHKHELTVVALWMSAGFVAQLWLRSLAPYDMSTIVESPGANAFYTVTQQYSASAYLSGFHALADSLPMHARANMPGKALLFYALEMVTGSTTVMAYLIVLISNLGALLAYVLAREWFQDRLTALYALILYLLLPAKLYFFPVLNTVTPVVMLLSLWLAVKYLKSRRPVYLLACGASVYGLAFFEPLPLVAGLIPAALLGTQLGERHVRPSGVLKLAAFGLLAFLAVHGVLLIAYGFNIFGAFGFALEDARAFNQRTVRPYAVWVGLNLRDFFLNMGLAQSVLFLASLTAVIRALATGSWQRDAGGSAGRYLARPDVLLTLAVAGMLLVLDLTGVNRGETVRLWIFAGVLMQIVVAHACAVRGRFLTFAAILAVTVLQTSVCMTVVGWLMP